MSLKIQTLTHVTNTTTLLFMPDYATAQDHLSIARHAIQALLHQALNTLPSSIYGLLSGRNRMIQTVSPFNASKHDLAAIITRDQAPEFNGMEPLAWYVSSASPSESVGTLRQRMMQIIDETDMVVSTRLRELPLLVVRLDTKGRMEALLFEFGNHQAGARLPLLLQEDDWAIPHEE